MNVAVILNTKPHAEVALSVYASLERIKGITPTLFPLCGDHWGLFNLLRYCGIRYEMDPPGSIHEFDQAVIVTAYPQGGGHQLIYMSEHPFVHSFKRRRILITHRTNRNMSYYAAEKVISLSRMSKNYGISFIYLCENPLLNEGPPFRETPRFLVQGRFEYEHRSLDSVCSILQSVDDNFEILFLGTNSENIPFDDRRILRCGNAVELDFYKQAASCTYVMPLLDNHTRNGSYVRERFSSSFLFTFAGLRPMLLHRSLSSIYPLTTAVTYGNQSEFIAGFRRLLQQDEDRLGELVNCAKNQRELMRTHNTRIFEKMLT